MYSFGIYLLNRYDFDTFVFLTNETNGNVPSFSKNTFASYLLHIHHKINIMNIHHNTLIMHNKILNILHKILYIQSSQNTEYKSNDFSKKATFDTPYSMLFG